jgi:hypothetical protein
VRARPVPKDAVVLLGVLALVALAFLAWFAGLPPGLPAWAPLAGAVVLGGVRFRALGWVPRPSTDTLACLAIALAYRAPALVHPWGWVNRDGAYGAFVAMHLRGGLQPAPVFTEGANYQGTLKGHIAAALSLLGIDDWSLLIVLAGVLLSLALVAAGMALARQIGGRRAALVTGLYLALPPRFLAVFSLNSVGQYVDVLALGGIALALIGRSAGEDSRRAPVACAAAGFLLGMAFWQQPVALSYIATAVVVLALRRGTGLRWAGAGFVVGVLPVLVWNVQNDWASGDIMGRDPGELRAQADALPRLLRRTLAISFPILAGLAPGHPWADIAAARVVAIALIPAALVAYLVLEGRAIVASVRARAASAALLPPVLLLATVALAWAAASGKVYWRPRYLLPVVAATAIHLGVVLGRLWGRSRPAAAAVTLAILLLNVAGLAFPPGDGTTPRLFAGAGIAAPYARLVRSLEEKGIRTGYSDFSLSAPVTMFTGERIVFSPRLGPTPAYLSEGQEEMVARLGPDAYVLRADDDPKAFAALLDSLGVTYRMEIDPVPIFFRLSRRVAIEEVAGFRGEAPAAEASGDES